MNAINYLLLIPVSVYEDCINTTHTTNNSSVHVINIVLHVGSWYNLRSREITLSGKQSPSCFTEKGESVSTKMGQKQSNFFFHFERGVVMN